MSNPAFTDPDGWSKISVSLDENLMTCLCLSLLIEQENHYMGHMLFVWPKIQHTQHENKYATTL